MAKRIVLCAVTAAKKVKEGRGFLPADRALSGKVLVRRAHPGRLLQARARRDGKETLVSRLIDRRCARCCPEGFYNEINVIAQVLSYDGETEPDIVAMIAASAALTISGVPFMGPIGACARRLPEGNGGSIKLNPSMSQVAEGRLDLASLPQPAAR